MTEMERAPSNACEMQTNEVSEVFDLLRIEVEPDGLERRPGREEATRSVSCSTLCFSNFSDHSMVICLSLIEGGNLIPENVDVFLIIVIEYNIPSDVSGFP